MWAFLTGILGLASTGIAGFFKGKEKEADVIQKAMDTVQNINTEDSNSAQAAATALAAIYQFGTGLERLWRPLLMIYLIVLVSLAMFSVIAPADWIMIELMSLLKAGVYGYIPLRTTEKLTTMFLVNKTLNKFLTDKLNGSGR